MKSRLLFILSLFVLSFTANVNAQTDVNNAQAVFIYNFLSHIQWPDSQVGNKYVIGVFGKTTTYGYLRSYTNSRKIGNRTIEVIQIKTPAEAKNCHVLLVAQSKSNLISSVKDIIGNKSCLIIGEKAGTTQFGAVVDFHIQNNKLRYKIDPDNAKEQHLLVSKALLNMSL